MSVDVAALALRIESIGFDEAAKLLGAIESQGVKASVTFKGLGQETQTTGTNMKRLEGVIRAAGVSLAGFTGQSATLAKTLIATWGPGGVATAAIVVGVGLVTKAFADGKKQAEAFQKAVIAAEAAALTGRPAALSPLAQAGVLAERITDVRGRRRGLVGETADRLARGEFVASSLQDTLKDDLRELARLSELEAALRKQADDEHQAAVTEAANTRVRAEEEALRLVREYNERLKETEQIWRAPALMGVPGGNLTNFGAVMDSLATRGVNLRGGIATDTGDELVRQAEELYRRHKKGLDDEAKAQQQLANTITAVAGAVAGLITTLRSGGGFWETVAALAQGIGTAVAFSNPVTGSALVAGGTIIGAFSTPSGSSTSTATTPRPASPVVVNATIIGENDPVAQKAIATMVQNAAARGYGG